MGCESDSGTWTSGACVYTTQLECEIGKWGGSGVCSDPGRTTKIECENPRGTWSSGTCSISGYVTKDECTEKRGSWIVEKCPIHVHSAGCKSQKPFVYYGWDETATDS